MLLFFTAPTARRLITTFVCVKYALGIAPHQGSSDPLRKAPPATPKLRNLTNHATSRLNFNSFWGPTPEFQLHFIRLLPHLAIRTIHLHHAGLMARRPAGSSTGYYPQITARIFPWTGIARLESQRYSGEACCRSLSRQGRLPKSISLGWISPDQPQGSSNH